MCNGSPRSSGINKREGRWRIPRKLNSPDIKHHIIQWGVRLTAFKQSDLPAHSTGGRFHILEPDDSPSQTRYSVSDVTDSEFSPARGVGGAAEWCTPGTPQFLGGQGHSHAYRDRLLLSDCVHEDKAKGKRRSLTLSDSRDSRQGSHAVLATETAPYVSHGQSNVSSFAICHSLIPTDAIFPTYSGPNQYTDSKVTMTNSLSVEADVGGSGVFSCIHEETLGSVPSQSSLVPCVHSELAAQSTPYLDCAKESDSLDVYSKIVGKPFCVCSNDAFRNGSSIRPFCHDPPRCSSGGTSDYDSKAAAYSSCSAMCSEARDGCRAAHSATFHHDAVPLSRYSALSGALDMDIVTSSSY